MFHYINWRPTSVIKKHSLPSETEFFLNKEGDINPPPQGQRDKETVPSVRTKGASEQKVSEQKGHFINN